MPQLFDYPTYAWQVWRGERSRSEFRRGAAVPRDARGRTAGSPASAAAAVQRATQKVRIRDLLETFKRRFEIIRHYCHMRKGEHLLTPEIEAELAARGYTRDELTCGSHVIVMWRTCNGTRIETDLDGWGMLFFRSERCAS